MTASTLSPTELQSSQLQINYELFQKTSSLVFDSKLYRQISVAFYRTIVRRVSSTTQGASLLALVDLPYLLQYTIQKLTLETVLTAPRYVDMYLDTFLLFKYLSCHLFYSECPLSAQTFLLLRHMLSFHYSNPCLYYFLLASMMDRNIFDKILFSGVKMYSFIDFKEVTDPLVFEIDKNIKALSKKQSQVISLILTLVASQFSGIMVAVKKSEQIMQVEKGQTISPLLKQMRKVDIRLRLRSCHKLPVETSNVIKERSKSVGPAEVVKEQLRPDALNMFQILSPTPVSCRHLKTFIQARLLLKECKLLEILPSLILADNILNNWVSLTTSFIKKRGLPHIGEELESIVQAILSIQTSAKYLGKLKISKKKSISNFTRLEGELNDLASKLLMENTHTVMIRECLILLNQASLDGFPLRMSYDLSIQPLDRLSQEAVTEILDFLLDKSMSLRSPHSRLHVFHNVAKFIMSWYNRTHDVPSADKLFTSLAYQVKDVELVTPDLFCDMLASLFISPDKLESPTATLIDLINFLRKDLSKQQSGIKDLKKSKHLELTLALLEATQKCHEQPHLQQAKTMIIKMLYLVLLQSNSFWNRCLKYEDQYKDISAIKDKLPMGEKFVAFYAKETLQLTCLYKRATQVSQELPEKEKDLRQIQLLQDNLSSPIQSSTSIVSVDLRYSSPRIQSTILSRSILSTRESSQHSTSLPVLIDIVIPFLSHRYSSNMQHISHASLKEKLINAERKKRYILTFSTTSEDSLLKIRGEMLLVALSKSISLDMCIRKFPVVISSTDDLGVTQISRSVSDPFSLFDPTITSVSPTILSMEDPLRTLIIPERLLSAEEVPLSPDSPPSLKFVNTIPSSPQISKITSSSTRYQLAKEFSLNHKKAHECSIKDLIELMPSVLGVTDKFCSVANVGIITGDNNFPIDSVLFIGEKGLYLRTNFVIKYEGSSVSIVSTEGSGSSSNLQSHGKWYLPPEEMTRPYVSCTLVDNKYRKEKAKAPEPATELLYNSLTEIHIKLYVGRSPIALEFWTTSRHPKLVVFNIHQTNEIWPLILEKWAKAASLSLDITEIKKMFVMPLRSVWFFLKSLNTDKPSLSIIEAPILAKKLAVKWSQGFIDNFTFLMFLNAAAGRSLLFLSSYYIFPQVVQEFDKLEGLVEQTFRDLSVPIGGVGLEQKDIQNLSYKCSSFGRDDEFHWGTLYSNKNTFSHFLYRVMPATKYLMEVNSGHVDKRMFKGMQTNFHMSVTQNFSEMLPENYYLEHYLVNLNNLAFLSKGRDKSETDLEDVDLPQWAYSPRHFTLRMRQALESYAVSKDLSKWIDLLFGLSQSGSEAVRRLNVFNMGSYLLGPEIVRDAMIEKPSTRRKRQQSPMEDIEGQLTFAFQCGQVPFQIFIDAIPDKLYQAPLLTILDQVIKKADERVMLTAMHYLQLLEISKDIYKTLSFSRLLSPKGHRLEVGPVTTILKKTKTMKARAFNGDLPELVTAIGPRAFYVQAGTIGIMGSKGEILFLSKGMAYVAYLPCGHVTSFEYDTYDSTLWVGNDLGDIHGFTVKCTEPETNEIRKDSCNPRSPWASMLSSPKPPEVLVTCLKKINSIDIYPLVELDQRVQKSILHSFSPLPGILPPKLLLHSLVMTFTIPGLLPTELSPFEGNEVLTSITKWKRFSCGQGKVSMIRTSSLSNILLSVHSPLTLLIWDVFEDTLLARVHPPHFIQPNLLNIPAGQPPARYETFLRKGVAQMQEIQSMNISHKNEDIVLATHDHLSLYSSSGMLIAVQRRTEDQGRFTVAAFMDYDAACEDHILVVGDDKGKLYFYTLKTLIREPNTETFVQSKDKNSVGAAHEQKRDTRLNYGYFINRCPYHKQASPLNEFVLRETRTLQFCTPVLDIMLNVLESRLYVLQKDHALFMYSFG